MIFVTVGAQMPFDRLIAAADAWTAARGRTDLFAQVGEGGLRPRHMPWTELLGPDEFRRRLAAADAVVSHAGMGTILSALELGKPIVVLPRLGRLGETRNDHQVATALRFAALGRVHHAEDEAALPGLLDRVSSLQPAARIPSRASEDLLRTLREVVSSVRR